MGETNTAASPKVAPGDLHREISRDPVAHAMWVCFQQGEFPTYEAFLTHLAVVLLRQKREAQERLLRLYQRVPFAVEIDPNKELHGD